MLRKSMSLMILIALLLSCQRTINSLDGNRTAMFVSGHILSGYHVTSIDFDGEGTAWIGTFKQGLIRYDGNTTVYNSANSSFPESVSICDICVDYDGHVWIGSGNGLIRFDGQEFTVHDTSNSPIAEEVVWAVDVDQDNGIWFSSSTHSSGGLMNFDGTDWTLYTPENSQLPGHGVMDIFVDRHNNVWAAVNGEHVGEGSILKIANGTWTIYGTEDIGFSPYFFWNLTADRNDNLYASINYMLSSSMNTERPNLIRFDRTEWTVLNPADERDRSLGFVGMICADLSGNVWATITDTPGINLAVFNGKEWFYGSPDIPIDKVSTIAVDLENNVWLGTWNGVYRIRQ